MSVWLLANDSYEQVSPLTSSIDPAYYWRPQLSRPRASQFSNPSTVPLSATLFLTRFVSCLRLRLFRRRAAADMCETDMRCKTAATDTAMIANQASLSDSRIPNTSRARKPKSKFVNLSGLPTEICYTHFISCSLASITAMETLENNPSRSYLLSHNPLQCLSEDMDRYKLELCPCFWKMASD
jgi:hypothetical protein